MTGLEDALQVAVYSEAYDYFDKAKAVRFDEMKLYWDSTMKLFTNKKHDFSMSKEELARRVSEIVTSEGISSLGVPFHQIFKFTPTPNEMKGFATAVYGAKLAKEIKKNPRKSGQKMKKAYRGMI